MAQEKPEPGDYIELKSAKGVFKGVLLPRPKDFEKDITSLKLDNGYNIGLKNAEIKLIKKKTVTKKPTKQYDYKKDLPLISIISTGGTIASYVDYNTGAVHPAMKADDLVKEIPEIMEMCSIRASALFSILSENMKPEYWQKLATKIADDVKEGVYGIVIPHGTDTMHYTASALFFMLGNLPVPVVLVGSQRSSDRPSTDAYLNTLSAISVAKSDLAEVVVLMHENTSDKTCSIHRGTRVRKMHTSTRNAFKSMNENPIGIAKKEIVTFLNPHKKRTNNEIELKTKMNEKVALLYSYPRIKTEYFEYLAEKNDGIVIMGTGLGHVSTNLIKSIKDATDNGKLIGMTSQCLYGSVNLNVYSTGRELLKVGVIPLGDMLPEVAYVKMMWVLANSLNPRSDLTRNLVGEISNKRKLAVDE